MTTNIVAHGFDITAPDTSLTIYSYNAGLVPVGTYRYKVTYVTHYGETLAGPASAPMTTIMLSKLNLSSIPVRALGNVLARKLYRSNGGPYLFIAEIPGNSLTTYVDNIPTGTTPEPDSSYASSVARELGWVINSRPHIAATKRITAPIDIDQYTQCAFINALAPANVRMPPVAAFQDGMSLQTVNVSPFDIVLEARTGTTIAGAATYLLTAGSGLDWTYSHPDWLLTISGGGGGGGGGVPSFSAGTTGLTPAFPTAAPIVLGGTLNAANGGTGRSTLTANALIAGNGTSPVQMLPITYNGATLTNVPNPVNILDIVNKQYVDGLTPPGAVLDPNAVPTYPTNATNGVWYGLDTRANSFDTTSVTIGRSARTIGANATAVGTLTRAAANTTAVGYNVLPMATAGTNVAVGVSLAPALVTGTNNVLYGLGITTAAASSSNVLVGHTLNTQSNNNVLVGHTLGAALTTGSNNIIVGRNCDVNAGNLTGTVMLGNGLLAEANNATYIQRRQATAGTVTLAAWSGNEIVNVPGVIFGASTPPIGSSTTVGTYTAQTDGATTADIFSVVTPNDRAYAIRANIVLGSSPSAGAMSINARAKNIAGALTVTMIVSSDSPDGPLGPASAIVTNTGTILRMVVTGVALLTVKWTAYIEMVSTSV
jgi:hypothetical protein